MQPYSTTTQQFSADQQWVESAALYDTPFTVLENGVASSGVQFDVVEPKDGTQATWKVFTDAFQALAKNTQVVSTFQTHPNVTAQTLDGRTDNVVGFWGGGSPGQHGASVPGRVAYHVRATLRAATARSWFSSATTPSWFLAVAGNGYFRIDKRVGATNTTIFSGIVTEKTFLTLGFQFSAQISDMNAGDYLDIYYIQTGSENWGGFVVKAVPGTLSASDAVNQTAAQSASILGCGLADDGAALSAQTLKGIKSLEISGARRRPLAATLSLPLMNATTNDGTGWKWIRQTPDDPGYLECWDGGVKLATVRRKRLVQLTIGFLSETYTGFTGFVEDFSQPDSGSVTLTLKGFESRLLDQHDKNYPDPISYMASGFRRTNVSAGTSEPIYAIPAYDNWPVEYAIKDLMLRNGVEASRLTRTLTVPLSTGSAATVTFGSDTFAKFRARTITGAMLRLDRPVHYGNAGIGFDEALPADDAYIFKPDVVKEVWNRCQELCDRIGYDLRFDEFGDAVMRPRNNPHFLYDLAATDVTVGTATTKTKPSAFGAKYLEFTAAATVVKSVTGARIDIVLPIGPSLSSWTYTVVQGGTTVASGTLTPTASADAYFFDGVLASDASNPTVVTLYSGDFATYTVTLSAATAGTRRLDALLAYHTDPMLPRLTKSLSTAQNALKVAAQSAMGDMRNSVIVVGRRKATVTDSDKFASNPNNPASEFIVERVVDKASITDRTAANYIGALKESIIYDSSITDNAYARYLARVFIYRYRNPKPPVSGEHTLLPVLQLNDPVYMEETVYGTVGVNQTDPRKSVLWVVEYKHKIDGKRATTTVQTQAFPDYPAFEPREDIDLSAFNGKPIVNMAVSYTSLAGDTRTNQPMGVPYQCQERTWDGTSGDIVTLGTVTKVNGLYKIPDNSPWPPVKGTVFINPVLATATATAADTYSPTTLHDWRAIRRGGVLPAVKLPYLQSITSVDITYRFEPTKQALPTRASEWYYEINDQNVLTVGGGDQHNNTADEVQAIAHWKQGEKDTQLGWVTNNPYHHWFNVDSRRYYGQENRLVQSQAFSAAAWTKQTGVTAAETAVGPDGVANSASAISWSAAAVNTGIYQIGTVSGASPNTKSVWVRADTAGGTVQVCDSANLIGTTVVTLTTAWQRVSLSETQAAGSAGLWVRKTASSPNTVYLFGGQLNQGNSANAYVATTTTTLLNQTVGATLKPVWNQGDGATMYQPHASTQYWQVKYRKLGPVNATGVFQDPYSGGSPFYDPYTSKLGYQVAISCDLLVSGLYRVSIRNVDDGTIVAWLTEPGADATNPEAHFQYFPAGSVAFSWDGVDNIGDWNARQSTLYAGLSSGVFEETQRQIGAGFYVWNRELADRQLGPMALISGQLDTVTGEPVFGHGTYAQWYVHVESKTDLVTTTVMSKALDAANNPSAAAIIYTHLPEPTKGELTYSDWISSSDYDPTDTSASTTTSGLNPANWGSASTDATVNNQKPVRIRFQLTTRPGPLWAGNPGDTVRLSRVVHLRATIMDQLVLFNGTNYADSSYEDRTIVNRRFVNDQHTLKYEDDNYREATSLKWLDSDPGTEWIFIPSQFKKNFRGIPNESIAFNDYLQIEELPKWDESQRTAIAGSRARMQLAFMNYLWYLSAYVTDRSGRSVWLVNRSFLDKSKIVNNVVSDWPDANYPQGSATASTYKTPWLDDLTTQQRRTVITRQWADEKVSGTDWRTSQATRYNISTAATSIGWQLLRHKWTDHDPHATTLNGLAWSSFTGLTQDNYSQWHTTSHGVPASADNPTLDGIFTGMLRQLPTAGLGLWTWETGPTWYPCISRDFHGYYFVPPMVNPQRDFRGWALSTYTSVDVRNYNAQTAPWDANNNIGTNEGSDVAAGEVWSSPIWDMTQAVDTTTMASRTRFWPGHKVSSTEEPTKTNGIQSNTVDYVRQDELVHWEDLRGMFSRGKRPTEQPIKVSPVQPYFINPFKYSQIIQDSAWQNGSYPNYTVFESGGVLGVVNWFEMKFRSEYYWESGTLFPVSAYGAERLEAVNAYKARTLTPTQMNAVRFDNGAWVGWKDDATAAFTLQTSTSTIGFANAEYMNNNPPIGRLLTPFEAGAQVVGVGPRLPQTKDMIFHMVLITERRSTAV